MLRETQLHAQRHAHEMDRREARRNRRTAWGGQPHHRSHPSAGTEYNLRDFVPVMPALTKPGFLSKVFSFFARKGKR